MAICAALKALPDRVEHVTYPGSSNFGCKTTRPPASKIRLFNALAGDRVQCASRRSKPQSAIADLYFAEELQACLSHDAQQGLAAAEILPLQSRQQESQPGLAIGTCCAADKPQKAPAMLPSGGAEWLLFTDAAHLVVDRPKLASESGRSKSA